MMPDLKSGFRKNYEAVEKDLIAIDNKIKRTVSKERE